jgi:hypothetical protein
MKAVSSSSSRDRRRFDEKPVIRPGQKSGVQDLCIDFATSQTSDVGGGLVKKLPAFALTGLGLALAGTAFAAGPRTHVMNVSLPDGSVARVEYVGDVAPKVTIAPVQLPDGQLAGGFVPSFAGFDRVIEQMNRETEAMIRQAQQISAQPGRPMMDIAGFGTLPAGANSVSVVSFSNGGSACTRTTEVVSQGAGKPPKVTTSVSGNCGSAVQPGTGPATGAIDRT